MQNVLQYAEFYTKSNEFESLYFHTAQKLLEDTKNVTRTWVG